MDVRKGENTHGQHLVPVGGPSHYTNAVKQAPRRWFAASEIGIDELDDRPVPTRSTLADSGGVLGERLEIVDRHGGAAADLGHAEAVEHAHAVLDPAAHVGRGVGRGGVDLVVLDLDLGPEIFAFSRCMVPDVEKVAQCGVSGIVVEIPSSGHIIKDAYDWPLEKALKASIDATLAAKEAGLYTVFFPIDASRADINWYLDLIEKIATEGHMDALAVVDTMGVLNPHAVPYLMAKIKERVDKLEDFFPYASFFFAGSLEYRVEEMIPKKHDAASTAEAWPRVTPSTR